MTPVGLKWGDRVGRSVPEDAEEVERTTPCWVLIGRGEYLECDS